MEEPKNKQSTEYLQPLDLPVQRRRILPPPGRSGSPVLGGGRYRPVITASISALLSTPDTCVLVEGAIGDMPLSPSGCGVDDSLTADGHNEVDARSRRRSCLLALSARRHHIIDPGRFLMGGTPAARRGDRGVVLLQDRLPSTAPSSLQRTISEAGLQGRVYGDNMIAQQSSSDEIGNPNDSSHSWAMKKPKTNDGDGATRPLRLGF